MQLLDTQKVKSDGVCFMPKILIVEDEPQLARFVQLELEHEEYELSLIHISEPTRH